MVRRWRPDATGDKYIIKGIINSNMKKIDKEKLFEILMITGIAIPCIIYLLVALYTYPNQDDFVYTAWMNDLMDEGHSVFVSAWMMNAKQYIEYRGYYFSQFLYYYFDGLIDCSIWGTRIFCLLSILLFYISLYVFIYMVADRIMHYEKRIIYLSEFIIFTCINCTYYFFEHEIFYWMCSVQVSLLPLIVMFVACSIEIYGLSVGGKKSVICLVITAILGFLLGGSLPNIALIVAVIFTMIAYWGIVVKKRVCPSILTMIPLIIGELVNALAPSSRNTVNTQDNGVLDSVFNSCRMVWERTREMLFGHPIIIVLFVILFLVMITSHNKDHIYKFPVPILFTLVMGLAQIIVTYPIILAYGIECARIMHRTLFVTDLFFYLSIMIVIYYWIGWIIVHFGGVRLVKWNLNAIYGGLIALALMVMISGIRNSAITKVSQELFSGRVAEYGNWCVHILEEIEDSPDDEVVLIHQNVTENTPLRNPYYHFGYHDPENEISGNDCLAQYYRKKVVYIYEE